MKKIKLLLFCFWALVFFCSCSSKTQQKAYPKAEWKAQMTEMSKILQEIYPLAVSEYRFYAPSNYDKISESSRRLSELMRNINHIYQDGKLEKTDPDPSIGVISSIFARNLGQAAEGFSYGKQEYARNLIRNSPQYCIQCHTRDHWGIKFTELSEGKAIEGMTPMEIADLYASTRFYDQALAIYQEVIKSPRNSERPSFLWRRAIRKSLNILVRVKKDPEASIALVSEAMNAPWFKGSFVVGLERWKKHLVSWSNEKKSGKNENPLKKARSLIKRAKKVRGLRQYESVYVLYLRASSLLHEYIRTVPNENNKSRAFYWLGQSYEGLGEDSVSDFDQIYYEACIKTRPHTKIATRCFEKYEESIFFQFLKSGDYRVSEWLSEHLKTLKNLASRKEKQVE